MAVLEEEEAGRSWDHTTNKRAHTYHPFVISCSWPSSGVVHNPLRLLILLGEMSCLLFQGRDLLRLGARHWLGAPNSWDTTGRSYVLDCSVRESIHLIFIGSTRWSCLHSQIQVGQMIVLVSLPYRLLYVSWKLKKKSSYSTQENNNLRNKMVERTYHKVLSAVVDALLHPPLAVFTPHMRLYKQLC